MKITVLDHFKAKKVIYPKGKVLSEEEGDALADVMDDLIAKGLISISEDEESKGVAETLAAAIEIVEQQPIAAPSKKKKKS